MRDAIEATGAGLHLLPPYSPNTNPIELAFPTLKALLPKAAARTIPDFRDAMRDALPQFHLTERANYFTPCRYDPE